RSYRRLDERANCLVRFFFQAEDGIGDDLVTGVQTCALPICSRNASRLRKQVQRNREAFREPPEAMPVYGTIAARFNDDGVTALRSEERRAGKGARPTAGPAPAKT